MCVSLPTTPSALALSQAGSASVAYHWPPGSFLARLTRTKLSPEYLWPGPSFETLRTRLPIWGAPPAIVRRQGSGAVSLTSLKKTEGNQEWRDATEEREGSRRRVKERGEGKTRERDGREV